MASAGWKSATLEPKGQLGGLVAEMELNRSEERKLLQLLKKEHINNLYQLSVLSDGDYALMSEKYHYPQGTLQLLQEKIGQIQLEENSTLVEVLIHATDALDVSEEQLESMVSTLEGANVMSAADLYRLSRSDLIRLGLPIGVATSIQLGFYLSNLVGQERASTVSDTAMLTMELELHKMDHLSVPDLHRRGSGIADADADADADDDGSHNLLQKQLRKTSVSGSLDSIDTELLQAYEDAETRYIFTVTFLSAHGLPKRKMMEVSPFLKASLNGVVHTTKHKPRTCNPIWDDHWVVRNVPASSTMVLEVHHRSLTMTNVVLGTANVTFGLSMIQQMLSSKVRAEIPIFDKKQVQKGQLLVEYSAAPLQANAALKKVGSFGGNTVHIHGSNFVGTLTGSSSSQMLAAPTFYCYEVRLHHVTTIFKDIVQPWNTAYEAARKIYGDGPVCLAVRKAINVQHQSLYREGLFRSVETKIYNGEGFLSVINNGERNGIPREYTYVLLDHTFNFSETGAALKDMVSKHASHSNAARFVRYAGEFHIQIDEVTGEYYLVIDNNSGTFAPKKEYLHLLKEVLELNFTNLRVEVYDREDPLLIASLERLRARAKSAAAAIAASQGTVVANAMGLLGLGTRKPSMPDTSSPINSSE